MTLQVNSVFIVGGDGKKVHLVPAADLEILQLLVYCLIISAGSNIEREHSPFFVCLNSLHFNVTKCCSRKNSASELKNLRQ